jgi:hypothetical protein
MKVIYWNNVICAAKTEMNKNENYFDLKSKKFVIIINALYYDSIYIL